MKMVKAIAAFSLLASVALAAEGWMTDYDEALKLAKKEGKTVLLDFSGSDWCGWCIRLDKEVFSKKEFKEFAEDNLVPVLIDFPAKKKQPAEIKEQNAKLQKKYGIRGYPTVILLNAEGKKIAQTGYRKGGAEKYVEHLKEMISEDK